MNIAQIAYWILVFAAAGLYVGVNVHFLRAIEPQPSEESCGPWPTALGHWAPQVVALVGVVLLLQLLVVPLVLAAMAVHGMLLVNNKKVPLLREPLLPSDIVMTLRHPHAWRLLAHYVAEDRWTIVATLAGLTAMIAGAAWEPWIFGRFRPAAAVLSPLLVAAVFAPLVGDSLMVRFLTAVGSPFWSWAPLQTVAAAGFFPTFLRMIGDVPRPAVHSMGSSEARAVLAKALPTDVARPAPPDRKPHLIVVLSEAFCDPRSVGLFIEPEPLTGFDETAKLSAYSGLCRVPIYGGWTTRSEFSLLTGISMSSLAGIVGSPYATLLRPETHSLPKYLETLGYRTVLVHPYDPKFYRRDIARLKLGFDAFLAWETFYNAAREGRYVSDDAVAARIEKELRQADRPTFLFCITMENHGPWDGETLPPQPPFTTRPPLSDASREALAHYLWHLRNADRMVRRLAAFVRTSADPTTLLFLGDHLPALPGVFAELGYPPIDMDHQRPMDAQLALYRTPYLLLSNQVEEHRRLDCDISLLPGLLLDAAAINGDGFFRENSAMRELTGGNLLDEATDENVRRAFLRYCYERAVFPERYVPIPPTQDAAIRDEGSKRSS